MCATCAETGTALHHGVGWTGRQACSRSGVAFSSAIAFLLVRAVVYRFSNDAIRHSFAESYVLRHFVESCNGQPPVEHSRTGSEYSR